MSKIGNKPIDFTGVQVEVKGCQVVYKGKNHAGTYVLPENLTATISDHKLTIRPTTGMTVERRDWGLHRALIANVLKGAGADFEQLVEITGLGFKAQVNGQSVVFSLGYTHKITVLLPKEVKLTVDKTGQRLTFVSFDKEKLGQVCAHVRSLRPPEPYKATGIKLAQEVIVRKAGKAKAGAGAGGA